jgi:hypothetical protein
MVKNPKQLLLIQLGVAVVVIIVLASGLSKLHFDSGEPLNIFALLFQNIAPTDAGAAPAPSGGDSSLGFFVYIFWALLAFSLIYAIISPEHRKRLLRSLIVILLLAFVLSRISEFESGQESSSESLGQSGAFGEAEAVAPEPPPFVTDPPSWFLVVVNLLLLLLIVGVIWYFWRRLRPKPDTRTLVIQEAETALFDLEAGGDLKDVVLQCYAGMSEVLRENRNIERRKAMTPREFEEHLTEIGMSDEHTQRLTQLFEGVRYGARPSRGRTVLEARSCLRAIIAAYGETA